jgi:hypothetical protein
MSLITQISNLPREQWDAMIKEAERRVRERWLVRDARIAADHARTERETERTATLEAEAVRLAEIARMKRDEAGVAYTALAALQGGWRPEQKARRHEAELTYQSADAQALMAEREANYTRRELENVKERSAHRTEMMSQRQQKLEAARIAAAAAKKAYAARRTRRGTLDGRVRLTSWQMRTALEALTIPTSYPRVARIGQAVLACWDSVLTDQQMALEIAYLTGEAQRPSRTAEPGRASRGTRELRDASTGPQ